MPAKPRLIRASEIGEYVYCHRAWWLGRIKGEASINVGEMSAGAGAHARHGQTVAAAGCLQIAAYLFLALAVAVAVIWFAMR